MRYYISLLALMLFGCGDAHVYTIKSDPQPNGCTVSTVEPNEQLPAGGALLTCGDTSALISNGTNGTNGENGQDGQDGEDGEDGQNAPIPPYSIVELIDPCGDASGIYDEILVKLNDTTIFASFSKTSGGVDTRLVLLTPGAYVTTDGTNCHFFVNSDYSVTW